MLNDSAWADDAVSTARASAMRMFRIPPFIADGRWPLPDELDADRGSATPDHFAASPRSGVALERQPQLGRQRIGIIDRDLGPRTGHILHDAGTRGKAAIEEDPGTLLERFSRFPLPC